MFTFEGAQVRRFTRSPPILFSKPPPSPLPFSQLQRSWLYRDRREVKQYTGIGKGKRIKRISGGTRLADQSSLLSPYSFSVCTCACGPTPVVSHLNLSDPAIQLLLLPRRCSFLHVHNTHACMPEENISEQVPPTGAREWKLRFRIYRAWPVPLFHGLLLATVWRSSTGIFHWLVHRSSAGR